MNQKMKETIEKLNISPIDLNDILPASKIEDIAKDLGVLPVGEVIEILIQEKNTDPIAAGFALGVLLMQKTHICIPRPPGVPEDAEVVIHEIKDAPPRTTTDVPDTMYG